VDCSKYDINQILADDNGIYTNEGCPTNVMYYKKGNAVQLIKTIMDTLLTKDLAEITFEKCKGYQCIYSTSNLPSTQFS